MKKFLSLVCVITVMNCWADDELSHRLPEVVVPGSELVDPEPASTFGTVASDIPFSPEVDLQSRNIPEAQGDLTIRGGTFETSGVSLGALSLFDPQTGHYLLELPVDPRMLTEPTVSTGAGQALRGFNASVGSLNFGFAPISESRAALRGALGSRATRIGSVYASGVNDLGESKLGADISFGDSTSQGTRTDGDIQSERVTGRLQLRTADSQTDLVAGYQQKYFSWPNLYALSELHSLVGSSGTEAERIGTSTFILNHTANIAERSKFEFGASYRRNTDDYDFDRFNPALFNAFRHKTRATTVAARADLAVSEQIGLDLGAQFVSDNIDSTALTAGNFNSRRYYKFSAAPTYSTELSDDYSLKLRAGASFDDTNRDQSRVSPISRISLTEDLEGVGENEFYVDISQSSQVAGYTALNSNASAGLFRGNPNLSRGISTNYEVGAELRRSEWRIKSATFYRKDKNLTDWTFQSGTIPFAARTAENVDVGVYGLELSGAYNLGESRLEAGYIYMDKSSDYENPLVDASFYALNYARHMWIGRADIKLSEGLRWVNSLEVRRQQPNSLRKSSGNTYALANTELHWAVPGVSGAELVAVLDNPWLENFQEVPGVPGKGRLGLIEARYSWN